MLEIKFKPSEALSLLPKLIEYIKTLPDKLYDIEIKQHREKRSIDANAYMWVLCEKIAQVLHTDKDSVYLNMLERYGVFTHIIAKPQAVDRFKAEYKAVKELGEVTVNGTTGIQLQCYFGSSTYDTKEMSRLIDGIVSECHDLDIETKTPDEIDYLKSLWGKETDDEKQTKQSL